MVSLLKKYKEALQHKHGWEVELECSKCHFRGKPSYEGWTPAYSKSFGNKPMIYADLSCPQCGGTLKDEAGRRLVELFLAVPIAAENRRNLLWFILFIVVVPLVLISILGRKGFTFFPFVIFLIFPAIMYFNYKVASIHTHCECGQPNYIFMGMLGRSYCYRCSSCGRLLRLRD